MIITYCEKYYNYIRIDFLVNYAIQYYDRGTAREIVMTVLLTVLYYIESIEI